MSSDEETKAARPSRRRKQVQAYKPVAVEDKDEWAPPQGKGVKLADQPYVDEMVRKEHFKSVLLKKACRLMYGRMVAAKKLKPTILEFSGLPDLDDDARDRLFARADKMSLDLLKRIMDLLGINRSSQSFEDKKVTKDNLCERIVEWLEEPTATKQKPPSQKRGRKKSAAAKPASKKRAAPAKKKRSAASKSPAPKKSRKAASKDDSASGAGEGLPDGVLGHVSDIIKGADTAELRMKEIYTKVNTKFSVELDKPQRRLVKAHVLELVRARNAGEDST